MRSLTKDNSFVEKLGDFLPSSREVRDYFIFAVIVVAMLVLIGNAAPYLPAFLFPIIFLMYAIVASMGTMYYIVKNRQHRQLKLNAHGKLSHYNRRWFFWFAIYLIIYFVSALIFVLQAPSWDLLEWILLGLSAVIFFGVYIFSRYICKKEFAEEYYKASAITLSIIATTVIVALVYAAVSIIFAVPEHTGIRDILDHRILPFENSPCAVLGELGKVTTFMNSLTQYGLNEVTGASWWIALILRFILSLMMFFGVVSLFGCCLLTPAEMKSEFELLPTEDAPTAERSVTPRYVLLLFGIWLVMSTVFICANQVLEEARATEEYSWIDERLEEVQDVIILATEYSVDEITSTMQSTEAIRKFKEEFMPRCKAYIEEHEAKLESLVSEYFSSCDSNLGSYMEWYESGLGTFAKQVKIAGVLMAEGAFDTLVVDPVDRSELDSAYTDYINGLKDLYIEYADAQKQLNLIPFVGLREPDEIVDSLPSKLTIWPAWNTKEGRDFAWNVLLYTDDDATAEDARNKIREYFSERQNAVDEDISKLSETFFPI